MQRAARDLLGLDADGRRPRGRGCGTPPGRRPTIPLRARCGRARRYSNKAANDYPFVSVIGDGVHEIPVGPVHAGTIEPGHFRFSIVGEKVLRLEERLGYTHKGIDKRFAGHAAGRRREARGARERRFSTVAYAWAYCMALESVAGCGAAGARAVAARAACSSASASPIIWAISALWATTPGSRSAWRSSRACKEDVLRLNAQLFGHRYLMDRDRARAAWRATSSAAALDCDRRRVRRAGARGARRCKRHLRRSLRAAGPLPHLRPASPPAARRASSA